MPVAHLGFVWPQIERFVKKLLDHDPITATRYGLEDILPLIACGRVRLWVAYVEDEFRAAMATELVQYPQCRECRIWFVAGERMKTWLPDWIATIEAYARAHACLRLATCGRAGWIKRAGAKEVGVEMIKPLWGDI